MYFVVMQVTIFFGMQGCEFSSRLFSSFFLEFEIILMSHLLSFVYCKRRK